MLPLQCSTATITPRYNDVSMTQQAAARPVINGRCQCNFYSIWQNACMCCWRGRTGTAALLRSAHATLPPTSKAGMRACAYVHIWHLATHYPGHWHTNTTAACACYLRRQDFCGTGRAQLPPAQQCSVSNRLRLSWLNSRVTQNYHHKHKHKSNNVNSNIMEVLRGRLTHC